MSVEMNKTYGAVVGVEGPADGLTVGSNEGWFVESLLGEIEGITVWYCVGMDDREKLSVEVGEIMDGVTDDITDGVAMGLTQMMDIN